MKRHGDLTREQILDAAERVFSEKGYNRTTFKEITSAAGSNIASINYHFGNKDKLYLEVFQRHMFVLRDCRIKSIVSVMAGGEGVTLEELLHSFSVAFFAPFLDMPDRHGFLKLMFRERIDPHLPYSLLAKDVIGPVTAELKSAIQKLLPELDERKLFFCLESFVGQLAHAILIKDMVGKLKEEKSLAIDLEEVIEHVVVFSAAGFRSYLKGGDGGGQ